MKKTILYWLLISAMSLGCVQAAPLLGNLANGVEGSFGGGPDSGDQFTTGDVGLSIGSVSVWWAANNGAADKQVGIFVDDDGLPGLTQIGTWFTSPVVTTGDIIITYFGSAFLAANTTYHVVLDITDNSGAAYTYNTDQFSSPVTQGASNPLGSSWGQNGVENWGFDGANLVWQLDGSAASGVPEPSTMALLGFGIAGLFYAKRRS